VSIIYVTTQIKEHLPGDALKEACSQGCAENEDPFSVMIS
jgi:hypothetical protein